MQPLPLARQIAAQLGPHVSAWAVRGFLRTLTERGGWMYAIAIRSCVACGSLFTARPGAIVHPLCRLPRINSQTRAKRAAGLLPKSTPYVRAYREREPARDLATRIKERLTDPHRPRQKTPAQKAAHSRAAIASRQRVADELREMADQHGEPWITEDDMWLMVHQDWSSSAAAVELGRTPQSILGRRRLLRRKRLLPPRGREPIEVIAPLRPRRPT